MNKIQQLEEELRKEKIKEAEKAQEQVLEDNYKRFLNRPEDWVIGKAHIEPTFKDNGWHHPKGEALPYSVQIYGNSGHTYVPTAFITDATKTYFHNVWTHKQQQTFEKKLNDLVFAEVTAIMSDAHSVLEIMGLQSSNYHLERSYPKDKVEEIRIELEKEQDKILDKFTDEELSKVGDLSHGRGILSRYMADKKARSKR